MHASNISSHLKLFANNTLLYAVIHSQADALSLQSGPDQLVAWSQITLANSFPSRSKCYMLRIHRSKNPIAHQYTIFLQKIYLLETTIITNTSSFIYLFTINIPC